MKYKSMKEYLALPWSFEVAWSADPQEPWTARVKELPGCMSHGVTPSDATTHIMEAIECYIESLIEDGEAIPEPVNPKDFKGIITYRTKPEKHYQLAKTAQRLGKSINKLIDEAIDRVISA